MLKRMQKHKETGELSPIIDFETGCLDEWFRLMRSFSRLSDQDQGSCLIEQYHGCYPDHSVFHLKTESNEFGALIHKSTKNGNFQLSYYDNMGFSGDTQHSTIEKAMTDAVEQGYCVPCDKKF